MSQSKYWCFTVNNYTAADEEKIKSLVPDKASYLVYGRERGESGTPHLQGYLELPAKRRLRVVKGLPGLDRAHLEVRRGSNQEAADYCKKDGDWEELGELSQSRQGRRSDLERVKGLIDGGASMAMVAEECFSSFVRYGNGLRAYKLLKSNPKDLDDVCGLWVYGPPGIGKSHYCRQLADTANKRLFIKPMNKWWDGYDGEEIVLLDDFDQLGTCLSHYLKIWADKYAFKIEVKGGVCSIRPEQFLITSNYSIEELFPTDQVLQQAITRRFKVIHMTQRNL